MKIGVTAWHFSGNGAANDLAEQGEIAERTGFDSFWLPENHFTQPGAIPSPLILLAAIASRTRQLKLGTTSYLLPIRNPILAAEEVAVLDRLSEGRVILGIGRGFQDAMFQLFNIPTRDKRKLFKANLDVMINAWAGRPIGRHEDSDILLSPLPVQTPHPPLWVAAFGPLAIKQAGSLGLPYIASPVETIDDLERNITQHTQHVADAGLPAVTEVPIMRTIFISESESERASITETLEKETASRFRESSASIDDWAIVGDKFYVADQLNRYAGRLGMNYVIARGRISGVSNERQIKSHETLSQLVDDLD